MLQCYNVGILFCAHELLVITWSRYNAIWLSSSAFKEEINLSIIVIVYILLKIYAWKCLPVWYDVLMVINNTNIWFKKFFKDQLQRWMFFCLNSEQCVQAKQIGVTALIADPYQCYFTTMQNIPIFE